MILPGELAPVDRYRLLTAAVVPRPIAWITTVDAQGRGNLAPFSAFQIVTATPMTVAVSIAHREPAKDTLLNLRATGVAVIHLVSEVLLEQAHASSAAHPHGVDEAIVLDLATVPAHLVAAPRLRDADLALECRLSSEVPVGQPPAILCLLEVVAVHVSPTVADGHGFPDPLRLRACARLGADHYLLPGAWPTRAMPRPRPQQQQQPQVPA
jgi:flavin reductase (DIM6/NTAB) family NADH-FMN oxidoreductase RutF